MNTTLNEMNQRFEKNEMAEKENMQARRDYYFKYRKWKDMVTTLNKRSKERNGIRKRTRRFNVFRK